MNKLPLLILIICSIPLAGTVKAIKIQSINDRLFRVYNSSSVIHVDSGCGTSFKEYRRAILLDTGYKVSLHLDGRECEVVRIRR